MGSGGPYDEESLSCDCAVAVAAVDVGEADPDDGMDDESEYSSSAPVRTKGGVKKRTKAVRRKSEKRKANRRRCSGSSSPVGA